MKFIKRFYEGFNKFFEKHIDSKRLKTGLLQSAIIGLFLLAGARFSHISGFASQYLWPWITYAVKVPLVPSLIILVLTHSISYKILKFFQIKLGESKKMTIPNWKAIPNYSNAQWTDYYEIALNGKIFQEISCKMQSSSQYFRFGFKLLNHSSSIFNAQGGLLQSDENLLLHIFRTRIHEGNTPGEQKLMFASYLNGIPKNDKELMPTYNNERVDLRLSVGKNNVVSFFVDNKEQHRININGNIRDRIILLAWGDGHEYEVDISEITISTI